MPASPLLSQCIDIDLPLPDVDSNSTPEIVIVPDGLNCAEITIDPSVTGHPTGFSLDLVHSWQGDLTIRIFACDETLLLVTRPGGGGCFGFPFGSMDSINGTFIFTDVGPNPDDGLALNGGTYGLSDNPCNVPSLSSFEELSDSCGDEPYTLLFCFGDHARGNDGFASNITPLFAGEPEIICGCTDPEADNYDPMANIDDGSCVAPCFPPDAPMANDTTTCLGEPAVLTAVPCDSSILLWYASLTDSLPLDTGEVFITPPVDSVTTFYVECQIRPGCASPRTAVQVQLIAPTPPALDSLGPFCPEELPITLPAIQDGITGTWSGTGVTDSLFAPDSSAWGMIFTLGFLPDAGQCADSAMLDVEIFEQPAPAITGPSGLCEAGTAVLTVEGTFASYLWSDGSSLPSIVVDTAGTYSVTVTTVGGGCLGTASYTLVDSATPEPEFASPPSICPDQFLTLSLTETYAAYTWSTGDTTASITVEQAGIYAVTVENTDGCAGEVSIDVEELPFPEPVLDVPAFCEGDSTLTLTLLNAADYTAVSWSTDSTGASTPVSAPGLYTVVTSTADGCFRITEIEVQESNFPKAEISGPLAFCPGDTATLTLTTSYASYLWSDGSEADTLDLFQPGSIIVLATDSLGCQSMDTVALTVYDTLIVSIAGDLSLCPGDSTLLQTDSLFTAYLWSDSTTADSLWVSLPGDYSLTVTDANGCQDSITVSVIENAPPDPQIIGQLSFCEGDSTTLSLSEAYASVLWSTGSTEDSITVFASGEISVSVTDSLGCTASDTVNISVADALEVLVQGDTVFCAGGSTLLRADTSLVSYLWSDGSTGDTLLVTIPGTYSLTATDASGCSGETTVEVTESPLPQAMIVGLLDFCAGDSTLLRSDSLSTAYLWSDGSTADSLWATLPGDYSLTVTDANGCQDSTTVSVIENAPPDPQIIGQLSFCEGDSTTLSLSDAYASVLWSTGSTEDSITVFASGEISVAVTDSLGCTASDTVNVSVADALEVLVQGDTVFCAGGSTLLQADTSLVSYLWSDGSTGDTLLVTIPGTYSLTATDASGCSGETTVEVTESPLPQAMIVGLLDFCAGDSTLLRSDSLSTAYLWSDGSTADSLWATLPGDYSLTVTDANGCQDSTTVSVMENAPPDPQIIGQLSFCEGDSTTLSLSDAYASVLWSTGSTEDSITVFASGEISVAVTDSLGCTASDTVNVSVADALEVLVQGDTVFCAGGSTLLRAAAGFDTYLWSDGSTADSLLVTAPGTYSVTATDVSGCSGETTVDVTENANPVAAISGDLAFCTGDSTLLTAPAGLSYEWSDGSTGDSLSVSAPGDYALTVTHANGCTDSTAVTVTEETIVQPQIVGALSFCEGDSTVLSLNEMYDTYLWSTGSDSLSAVVLTGGTVSVTVTAANGCEAIAMAEVEVSEELSVPISGDLAFCAGDSTLLRAAGGFDVYLWSDGSTADSLMVTAPGTYSVTATDASGCTGETTVDVTENANPVAAISGDLAFCTGDSTLLTAPAGLGYLWSDGSTGDSLSISAPGDYALTVTDASGCTDSTAVTVTEETIVQPQIVGTLSFCEGDSTVLSLNEMYDTYLWSTGSDSLSAVVLSGGTVSVTVTAANGCEAIATAEVEVSEELSVPISGDLAFCAGDSTLLRAAGGFDTYLWSDGSTADSLLVTAPGTYSVTATDASGCTGQTTVDVTENANPVAAISGDLAFCTGDSTLLTATAGLGYLWSDGSTGDSLSVTLPGNYALTVTDANGCIDSTAVTVTEETIVQPQIVGALSFCEGDSTVLSLNEMYDTYLWSTGSDSLSAVVLSGGIVSVTVTAANGCEAIATAEVEVSEELSVPISGDLAFCAGDSTLLRAAGGFDTYLWSDGSTADSLMVTAPGTYSVTATDASGCTGETTVDVIENANPVAAISGDLAFCTGDSTLLTAPAGLDYEWSDGSTGDSLFVALPGDYALTVTDANGCSDSTAVTVTEETIAQPQIVGALSFCEGDSTILTLNEMYDTYSWSTGSDSLSAVVLAGGTVSVTVTAANGCEAVATAEVEVSEELSVPISGDLAFCAGDSTLLRAAGGFDTYLWSDGSTADSLIVTAPGTYSVTATDASGCTGETTVDVIENANPVAAISGDLAFCTGDSTLLTAPAGLDYEWSDGSTGDSLFVALPGDYALTVTDANGCTDSTAVTVTEETIVQPQIVGALSFCEGDSTVLTLNEMYDTYLWSTGSDSLSAVVLAGGTVSVTVTAANGCEAIATAEVEVSEELSVPISGDLAFCAGDSTLLRAAGGFDTYLWSDGSTADSLMVTAPGTYSVTATDASGCSGETTVDVTENANPIAAISGDLAFCTGDSTLLTAPAGLDYEWSDGSTGDSLFVALPGDYALTVTDANGCTDSTAVTVTEETIVQPQIVGALSFCEGDSTILTLNEPYDTYLWSTGSDSLSAVVLAGGTVSVTVTAANGCEAVATAEVEVSEELSVPISGDLSFCAGDSTLLRAAGGFDTYLWSDGSMGDSLIVTAPGTYSVTATDASGCTGETTVDVIENANPVAAISGDLAFCTGDSTLLTAPAGLGYLWSDGSTGDSLFVALPGNYALTVTDANGCIDSTAVTVTEETIVQPQIVGTLSFCEGDSTVLSLNEMYDTYLWSTGSDSLSAVVLTGGTVSVTVTAANGCEAIATAEVEVSEELSVPISGDLAFCAGDSTLLRAAGGFDSYLWSDGSTADSLLVTAPGTYSVTATDASGCTGETTVDVTENANPVAAISGDLAFCTGDSTLLTAPAGLSYEWSDGSTGDSLFVALPGDYDLTVTDANGCIDSTAVTVTEETIVQPQIVGARSFCEGDSTILSLNEVYDTYLWSTGSDSLSAVVLAGGTVSVTVTAANGCEAVATAEVEVSEELSVPISGDLAFCAGDSTLLRAAGGFDSYLWSDGSTADSLMVTAPGTYSVTATDASGCSGETTVDVIENATPVAAISGDLAFCMGDSTLLTAPAGLSYLWSDGSTGDSLSVSVPGDYALTVTDANGCTDSTAVTVTEETIVQPQIVGALSFCEGDSTVLTLNEMYDTYLWSTGSDSLSAVVLAGGTVSVTVTAANGCEAIAMAEVEVSEELSVPISGDLAFCAGDSTLLRAAGGFDSYLWSDGSTADSLIVTAPGTYSVTATDASGCTGETTVDVTENVNPIAAISGDLAFCTGDSTLLTAPTGLSYEWSDGSTADSLSVSIPGNYALTVTDANGCSDSTAVTVTEETIVQPQIVGALSFCEGDSTILTLNEPYDTYLWSTGSDSLSAVVLAGGTVSVTVTAANGCEAIAMAEVEVSEELSVPISGDLSFCAGDSTLLRAAGGFDSYLWSDGSTADSLMVTAPGTYSVTATDGSGCSGETTVDVIENANPVAAISGDLAFCTGDSTLLTAPAGLSYEWSDGSTGDSLSVSVPGDYALTVTDANGCTDSIAVTVTEETIVQPQIVGALSFCEGDSTILSLNEPYDTYLWSTGSDSLSAVVLAGGTVSVTVTAANGCEAIATAEVEVSEELSVPISGDLSFCAGDSTLLRAAGGFDSYLWSDGSTADSLMVTAAGSYSVTVSSASGCEGENTVEVVAQPLPSVAIVGDLDFCAGDSTLLSATPGLAAYLWSTGITDAQLMASEPGVYTITATDEIGCSNEASVTVQENALPEPVISGLDYFCAGDSTVLSAEQGFEVYEWNGMASEAQIFAASAGTYTLMVVDSNGCTGTASLEVAEIALPQAEAIASGVLSCAVEEVVLDGTGSSTGPNFTYEWSGPGIDGQSAGLLSPTVQVPGSYTLSVIDTVFQCVSEPILITVEQDTLAPVASIADVSQLDCAVLAVTLSAMTATPDSTVVYTWADAQQVPFAQGDSAAVSEPGLYYLFALDTLNGCSSLDSVEVEQDIVLPAAEAGEPQQLDCNQPDAVLNAAGSSEGAGFGYEWALGDTSNVVGMGFEITIAEPGTYYLVVTNLANSCQQMDSVEVIQLSAAPSALSVALQVPTCFGDGNGQIAITGVEGGTPPYLYSFDGQPFSAQQEFDDLDGGTYAIIVQDATGCEYEEMVVLPEGNDLNVDLGANITVKAGQSLTLDAQVNVPEDQLALIAWQGTEALSCTDCLQPTLMPTISGPYEITVTDINGCVASAQVQVFVDTRRQVYVPNIFSPNGDNNNDVFYIQSGTDVVSIRRFVVYDRWGERVFEVGGVPANDPQHGWDGIFRGEPMDPAVFVWQAEIEFADGATEWFQGEVVLLR